MSNKKAPEGAFCYFLVLALGLFVGLAFCFALGAGGAEGFLLLGFGFLTLARVLPSLTTGVTITSGLLAGARARVITTSFGKLKHQKSPCCIYLISSLS